jgi:hypothetical protein
MWPIAARKDDAKRSEREGVWSLTGAAGMPRPAVSDNKVACAAVDALLSVQASGSLFAAAPGWCIGHDSLR